MDFRYTEEQLALRETLHRFIARDYDFARRRALVSSPLGFSAEAWAQYADLGVLALPFPQEYGGLGGNPVDMMVVMELVGQGLLLEPILSTVVMCGGVIRDAASEAMKRALLPQIGAGSLQLAFACYEAAGRYDLASVACRARPSGDGWCLSGRKNVVLDAPSADGFLVSARVSGQVADSEGISWSSATRQALP
jgi:alkylation response protein AidB-like acyl-CoA dehydrogenase